MKLILVTMYDDAYDSFIEEGNSNQALLVQETHDGFGRDILHANEDEWEEVISLTKEAMRDECIRNLGSEENFYMNDTN